MAREPVFGYTPPDYRGLVVGFTKMSADAESRKKAVTGGDRSGEAARVRPSTALKSLDKDLKGIGRIQQAGRDTVPRAAALGICLVFLVLVWAYVQSQSGGLAGGSFIVAAAVIGGYMALNIGANDVANNVGPAVGSRALTMVGALMIAAVFETAGAIIAGGDVVRTVSKGIIDPGQIADPDTFVRVMLAALLAAALWINMATYLGAPVSTTHAIVGAVMGAGIVAAGFSVVNWPTMAKIAASWMISPVLGGLIAAIFLAFIKFKILFRDDKLAAAKTWVPVLVGLMAGIFSMYLVTKGLKKVWKPDFVYVLAIGVGIFAATYAWVKPRVARRAETLENRRKAVSSLFVMPLICSAALLSFAHGANDVANAVGPLAAIVHTVNAGGIGISAGLFLFGPKLIRTVGEKITKLDPLRAFCVALSAAITVIIASGLGLPVSSTHIAIGGIFGVGFFREFHANWLKDALVRRAEAKLRPAGAPNTKQIKKAKKARRRKLVRRRQLIRIVAAWLVTVPLAGLLSAGIYIGLRDLL